MRKIAPSWSDLTPKRKPKASIKSFRDEIILLHEQLFKINQRKIRSSVEGYTSAFKKYEKHYQDTVADYAKRCSVQSLLKHIFKSRCIIMGDYHTLLQSRKAFLKLLQHSKHPHRAIALEIIPFSFQKELNAFLQGKLSFDKFASKLCSNTNISRHEFESYLPILNFAKQHHMPVLALDIQKRSKAGLTLLQRDRRFAKIIVQFLKKYSEYQILCLVGGLHVAPKHLPQCIEQEFNTNNLHLEPTLIFQNSEKIYFKLQQKRQEHNTHVVYIKKNQYCLFTTPPVIQQQSFINHLESHDEDDAIEMPTETFHQYAQILSHIFQLPIQNALKHVHITSVADLNFVSTLSKKYHLTKFDIQCLKKQILHNESYFIPKANLVYLGNLSINHASEEATHWLRFVCSHMQEPTNQVDLFYSRCMEEAIGFLGSKIINHRRKCSDVKEFESIAKHKKSSTIEKNIAKACLNHIQIEQGKKIKSTKNMYQTTHELFHGITHALGYRLGNRMYYAMIQGKIKKSHIRALFFEKFDEPKKALLTYLYFIQKTKDITLPNLHQI